MCGNRLLEIFLIFCDTPCISNLLIIYVLTTYTDSNTSNIPTSYLANSYVHLSKSAECVDFLLVFQGTLYIPENADGTVSFPYDPPPRIGIAGKKGTDV